MNHTAIIVLAAGKASRFGSIKQLLRFNNTTLLDHSIDEAIKSGARPVIVVTGSHAEKIVTHITQEPAAIVYNGKWEEGIASSIIAGVYHIVTALKTVQNIIITVSDQPFINTSLFTQLIQKQSNSQCGIVACMYSNTMGTPVLFTQKYFSALMGLQGDEGAKKIVIENSGDVSTIEFPQGSIDIDTVEDYQLLLDRQQHVL